MGVRQGRNATEEAVENEGSDPMVGVGFQREQTAETQKQLGKHRGEAAAQIPCPAIWLPVSPLTPFGCLGFGSKAPEQQTVLVSSAHSHPSLCWLPPIAAEDRVYPAS